MSALFSFWTTAAPSIECSPLSLPVMGFFDTCQCEIGLCLPCFGRVTWKLSKHRGQVISQSYNLFPHMALFFRYRLFVPVIIGRGWGREGIVVTFFVHDQDTSILEGGHELTL